ncbi:response regulator [Sphingomonas sp. A2-49]|uniref:response regulator n=1 Tax=Sphingomonas sp. A2-49 TaxID=1391375 RepID=UPI0021D39F0A|nr:response regulator [Sphingomonas sp. A2-49]MCU6455003.1 response regulator [Sphingomonas sp. A2-49]
MTNVRLLIIEDSSTARAIIERLVVEEPGAEVVGVAADAETARTLLDVLKPNLITLDLNMPGAGGLAFLDRFATPRHAPIVVLSSSTRSGSDRAAEVMKAGAAAFFDKSLLTKEAGRFRAMLRKVLAKREHETSKSVFER